MTGSHVGPCRRRGGRPGHPGPPAGRGTSPRSSTPSTAAPASCTFWKRSRSRLGRGRDHLPSVLPGIRGVGAQRAQPARPRQLPPGCRRIRDGSCPRGSRQLHPPARPLRRSHFRAQRRRLSRLVRRPVCSFRRQPLPWGQPAARPPRGAARPARVLARSLPAGASPQSGRDRGYCRDGLLLMGDLAEKPAAAAARALEQQYGTGSLLLLEGRARLTPVHPLRPAATRHQPVPSRSWHWRSPPTPALTRSSYDYYQPGHRPGSQPARRMRTRTKEPHAATIPRKALRPWQLPTWDTDACQYVIQGFGLDSDTLAQVGDISLGELVIRVPKELMCYLPEVRRDSRHPPAQAGRSACPGSGPGSSWRRSPRPEAGGSPEAHSAPRRDGCRRAPEPGKRPSASRPPMPGRQATPVLILLRSWPTKPGCRIGRPSGWMLSARMCSRQRTCVRRCRSWSPAPRRPRSSAYRRSGSGSLPMGMPCSLSPCTTCVRASYG